MFSVNMVASENDSCYQGFKIQIKKMNQKVRPLL